MKAEKLNYEAYIYYFSGREERLEFHGDNAELAKDHIQHVLNSDEKIVSITFRKISNIKWITVTKQNRIKLKATQS